MNRVLLILFFSVSIAGGFSFENLLPILTQPLDPITIICTAITNNPSAASNVLQKLENAFANGYLGQAMPLSVQYINQESVQLLAGGSSCQSFFGGLETPFQTDLQNDKQTIANAKQPLVQFIQKQLTSIETLFG